MGIRTKGQKAAGLEATDMMIKQFLAGLPNEPLKYEDVPEYVPMGREWPE